MVNAAPEWRTSDGAVIPHRGPIRPVQAVNAQWSGVDFGRIIGAMALTTALVCGLYLIKSALGINLLEGHFFLHDALYPLVR